MGDGDFKIPPELEPFHAKLLDGLEFCRLTYLFFESVAKGPDGTRILRERKGPVKQLLEELFPICRYIQTFYGPGQYMSVLWMHGNQSYDAKVSTAGFLVDHGMWPPLGTLEITQAVHHNEHLMRERLASTDQGGFGLDGLTVGKGKRGARKIDSQPTVYTNQSYIGEMCAIIISAVKAKIIKLENGVYPSDTTLIVDCTLMTIFMVSEWTKLVRMVEAALPANDFARIFLTANSGSYFATLAHT